MKHYKYIIILFCAVIAAICISMIIRVNIAFPKADDITFTKDKPANINGLLVSPIEYKIYTIDEYSEKISSKYDSLTEGKKKNSRVVVLTLSFRNNTDKVIDYMPDYIFVSEELNAHNGATPLDNNSWHVTVLPGEEKKIQLQVYLGPNQLNPRKINKLDKSTITLVYSFYPYRKIIVFN